MEKLRLDWVCTASANAKRLKIPKWQRSAAMAADGTVYVPGFFAGHEKLVFLCAVQDGIGVIFDTDHHLYVPAKWMATEFPDLTELCGTIEGRMRRELKFCPSE
jgi:hypothetical protein